MKLLNKYENGNYTVKIYEDGTKVKTTQDDHFDSAFPESIDMKITNWCDKSCPMCHEKSTINGKHGDIDWNFIKTLTPGTEIAIGGGLVTSHPQLLKLLGRLRNQGVITNITFEQSEFVEHYDFIMQLAEEKLIWGIGVSYHIPDQEFFELIENNKNIVLHVINGLIEPEDFIDLMQYKPKLLILGYKQFGRGITDYKNYQDYIETQKQWLSQNIMSLMQHFPVVSFDNLAIKQLKMKGQLPQKVWEKFYQGDDGTHTMYIDLVEGTYGKNSTAAERYKLKENIEDMFLHIKGEHKNG